MKDDGKGRGGGEGEELDELQVATETEMVVCMGELEGRETSLMGEKGRNGKLDPVARREAFTLCLLTGS